MENAGEDPFADNESNDAGMVTDAALKLPNSHGPKSSVTCTATGSSTLAPSGSYQSGTSSASGLKKTSGGGQTATTLSSQIRKLKNAASAPRILCGGTTIRTTSYGDLNCEDGTDNRFRLAHLRELYDQKINVSTSFNPSSLTCTNCTSRAHSIMPLSGQGHSSPVCLFLSDQNFPPALPTAGTDCCVAIIRVEDASLDDLVGTFLRLTKGCDLGIGSVVILCSLNHLGKVGTTTYAEDLVQAFQGIHSTFGGQVRALHGYPLPSCDIKDQITIRALLEIEAWLALADQRRAHSLERTS